MDPRKPVGAGMMPLLHLPSNAGPAFNNMGFVRRGGSFGEIERVPQLDPARGGSMHNIPDAVSVSMPFRLSNAYLYGDSQQQYGAPFLPRQRPVVPNHPWMSTEEVEVNMNRPMTPPVHGNSNRATTIPPPQRNINNELVMHRAVTVTPTQRSIYAETVVNRGTVVPPIQRNPNNDSALNRAATGRPVHINLNNEMVVNRATTVQPIQQNPSNDMAVNRAMHIQPTQGNFTNDLVVDRSMTVQPTQGNLDNDLVVNRAMTIQTIQRNLHNETGASGASTAQPAPVNLNNDIAVNRAMTLQRMQSNVNLPYRVQNGAQAIQQSSTHQVQLRKTVTINNALAHAQRVQQVKSQHTSGSGVGSAAQSQHMNGRGLGSATPSMASRHGIVKKQPKFKNFEGMMEAYKGSMFEKMHVDPRYTADCVSPMDLMITPDIGVWRDNSKINVPQAPTPRPLTKEIFRRRFSLAARADGLPRTTFFDIVPATNVSNLEDPGKAGEVSDAAASPEDFQPDITELENWVHDAPLRKDVHERARRAARNHRRKATIRNRTQNVMCSLELTALRHILNWACENAPEYGIANREGFSRSRFERFRDSVAKNNVLLTPVHIRNLKNRIWNMKLWANVQAKRRGDTLAAEVAALDLNKDQDNKNQDNNNNHQDSKEQDVEMANSTFATVTQVSPLNFDINDKKAYTFQFMPVPKGTNMIRLFARSILGHGALNMPRKDIRELRERRAEWNKLLLIVTGYSAQTLFAGKDEFKSIMTTQILGILGRLGEGTGNGKGKGGANPVMGVADGGDGRIRFIDEKDGFTLAEAGKWVGEGLEKMDF